MTIPSMMIMIITIVFDVYGVNRGLPILIELYDMIANHRVPKLIAVLRRWSLGLWLLQRNSTRMM